MLQNLAVSPTTLRRYCSSLEACHDIGDAPIHIIQVMLLLFFNVLKQI